MDWRTLLRETSRLLGHDTPDCDADVGGLEIALDGFPSITVEKVPERDLVAVSGLLCRYPDRERLFRLFEGLMNAHAFGMHTDNAYFAANSSLGQVIMHKLLPLNGLSPEGLRAEVETFIGMLKRWCERYASGEIEGMADGPADGRAEIPSAALRA